VEYTARGVEAAERISKNSLTACRARIGFLMFIGKMMGHGA
jgi:hypothetical protein